MSNKILAVIAFIIAGVIVVSTFAIGSSKVDRYLERKDYQVVCIDGVKYIRTWTGAFLAPKFNKKTRQVELCYKKKKLQKGESEIID